MKDLNQSRVVAAVFTNSSDHFRATIQKVKYTYEDNALVVQGTRAVYPDGTVHFVKHSEHCSICGITDLHTHCSEQANCLNIPLEVEQRLYPLNKKVDFSRLVYKIKNFGIIQTGVRINGKDFWHFKKGDVIDSKIMEDDGVKIVYKGVISYKYNKDIITERL